MAFQLQQFFNGGNFNRLRRLLESEGVPLPYAANDTIARKVNRLKQYFESIGYDARREYSRKEQAEDLLRDYIQAHVNNTHAYTTTEVN